LFFFPVKTLCKYESVPTDQPENLWVALGEIEWNGEKRSHKKNSDTLPWLNDVLKQSLKSKITQLKNKVIKTLRQAKAKFFIDTFKNAGGNGKKIWQTINKLIGRKQL